MSQIDHTHDASLRSWVQSANGHPDFPIQNLPHGVFSPNGAPPRGGIAIGDHILDLESLVEAGLLAGEAASLAARPELNAFFALGAGPRTTLRHEISALLADTSQPRPEFLHDSAACRMHLPATIGDYTDFYAGIHHALNVGLMLRPDQPLMPNYKHVPVGYHGRASSVRPSGLPVIRPSGQRKPGNATEPSYGPSRNLDYELELGIWIGPGNELGAPIGIAEAADHIAGFCLLNDWSARDIQGWEYQPLGPFLGKSFHTSISPWVITSEAMAPFRMPQDVRPEGDPAPLDYLANTADQAAGALNVELEAQLLTPRMRDAGAAPHRLSLGHTRHMYWTPAQLATHHTSNGCDLRPGDLFGTGTLSGPTPESAGSLLELSRGGRAPLTLPSGETRRFLEDGDTVILLARAHRPGFVSIGFGPCIGTIAGRSSEPS
jgi:fumarylacetoacetase